ncbi:hypothetical protein [Variovorax sp. N23]|uniref:hypothetical protein n=1 Tax=Variovorax sp. N23 TaxID=2980555 RepID=UPI0021C59DEA|nr:hypothetical protein [Variovorax sp. N23]MCU4121127.1 hypothetical protein [Variovorax sp. N23]
MAACTVSYRGPPTTSVPSGSNRGQPLAVFMERQTRDGDRFVGWCLRCDTLEELEAFAAHHGTTVDPNTTGTAAAPASTAWARTPTTAR